MEAFFELIVRYRRAAAAICVIGLILTGVGLRVWQIHTPDFIFFDEGYYLNYTRPLGEAMMRYGLNGPEEWRKAFHAFVKTCLASGKSLWFLIVEARIFFGGLTAWSTSRMWACFFGLLTLPLTYIFARRYYGCPRVAGLAFLLLCVLPSHVFYSRVGLQEALSTFLVLGGFFLYFFPDRVGRRTVGSGLVMGLAFLSNYRLIMLPVLVAWAEGVEALLKGRRPSLRRWVWFVLPFCAVVFGVGALYDGVNTRTTFSWMFYQAHLAEGVFDVINFLSYPYYVWRLDHPLLAVFLFSSLGLVCFRQRRFLLPFFLVAAQMVIFSLAAEKGARYLCVVTPFLTMAAAFACVEWFSLVRDLRARSLLVVLIFFLPIFLLGKSCFLVAERSDYRQSADDILAASPGAQWLSTQPYIQKLYVREMPRVVSPPRRFARLPAYRLQGYEWLVIGPQAFISWTEDERRFHPPLVGYMQFALERVRPWREYDHLGPNLLDRFVFEHSENLRDSMAFLKTAGEKGRGRLRVYQLDAIIGPVINALAHQAHDSLRETP